MHLETTVNGSCNCVDNLAVNFVFVNTSDGTLVRERVVFNLECVG